MKPIIDPLPREELISELNRLEKVRNTKRAQNEIYIFDAAEAPSLMREVGRLREVAFRGAGGGTGLEVDIDAEDLAKDGYMQLIVWDPSAQQIVGGYRFIVSDCSNPKNFSTEHYFRFSDKFRKRYMPYTIELGRSFVQPDYQARRNPKSLFALDNLWDGLGALVVLNPRCKYLFGKVTMYSSYNTEARRILFRFLKSYFGDKKALVEGINPVKLDLDAEHLNIFAGNNFEEDYKTLVQHLRQHGENIPPLINSYMNLSPTMLLFDTVINPDFGDVDETGILVTVKDVYPEKKLRHIRWDGWRKGLSKRREAFAQRLALRKQ